MFYQKVFINLASSNNINHLLGLFDYNGNNFSNVRKKLGGFLN